MLLVNRKPSEDEVRIAFENLGDKKHWIAETIDEMHDLEKTAEGDLSEDASLTIPLSPYGVTLIRLGGGELSAFG